MFDERLPGAALEAPETFCILAAPLWPRLLRAIGYQGAARWVALYINGNDVLHHDGAGTGTGDNSLFLVFKHYPMVAPHLAGAHLGTIEEEARECLVIDTQQHVLCLASCDDARRFLVAQWPRYESVPAEYTEEERAQLMKAWQEGVTLHEWTDHVAEAMRERRANARLMRQWLNQL